jgi:hypothetical protein
VYLVGHFCGIDNKQENERGESVFRNERARFFSEICIRAAQTSEAKTFDC